MNADERNDLPPPAAGGGGAESDPELDAFDDADPADDTPEPIDVSRAKPASEKRPSERSQPAEAEHHPQFVGTGVFWGLVVGVVLAVIVIAFASQNTQAAQVNVAVWDWSAPLFVIVLISLLIGIVLDEIVGLLFRSRRRRHLAEKAELHRLRGRR